jgi:hypothetical protein
MDEKKLWKYIGITALVFFAVWLACLMVPDHANARTTISDAPLTSDEVLVTNPLVRVQPDQAKQSAQYPYLSTRTKEEVCANWARGAVVGALVAKAGDTPETGIQFEPSGYADADKFARDAIQAGFDFIKSAVNPEGLKQIDDDTIAEHVGDLAFTACMDDDGAPGIVAPADPKENGKPKTEL